MVSHHLVMFGGYCSIAIGYIKYLICHVTLQNYLIEGSSNFMSGNSSWYVTTLPSLVSIGILVLEIYHVIKVTIMIQAPQDK